MRLAYAPEINKPFNSKAEAKEKRGKTKENKMKKKAN
jgi:hypothetical protein